MQQLVILQAGAAVLLSFSSVSPMAIANEFDILGEEVPSANFVIDDAGVLSKAGMKSLNNVLKTCEIKTGYRITAITTRKLEFESDAFAFADKVGRCSPAAAAPLHVPIFSCGYQEPRCLLVLPPYGSSTAVV